MTEAIDKSKDDISGRLYIPIYDEDMVLQHLNASKLTIFGPIFLYNDYAVASSFGAPVVMEVYAPFVRCGLDISWISSFPEIHRVLYMNCTFQISNIHSSSLQPPDYVMKDEVHVISLLEMEDQMLMAASKIKIERCNAVSLNEQRHDGIFGDFSDKEIVSLFRLLLLQYQRSRRIQIQNILRDKSKQNLMATRLRAILYLRDHVVSIVKMVKTVTLDEMSKTLQSFLSSQSDEDEKEEDFQEECMDMEIIEKLFPDVAQWEIAAADFSLFLEYVSGQRAFSDNLKHIHLVMNESDVEHFAKDISRETLKAMRQSGWKFLTSTDICHFGAIPEPEPPFMSLFYEFQTSGNDTFGTPNGPQSWTSEYNKLMNEMELQKTIGDLEEFEVIGDGKLEVSARIIESNTDCCHLSSFVFYALDYQMELVRYLKMLNGEEKAETYADSQFLELLRQKCCQMWSLVLDPLPLELAPIFGDSDEVKEDGDEAPLLSFASVFQIFPNLTDLYLSSTTFGLAICMRFIEFIQSLDETESLKLERIHFSTSDPMKQSEFVSVQWRLIEIGWKFLKSRQILTVFTSQMWQCTECLHQNRSLMVGGVYPREARKERKCGLCFYDENEEVKERVNDELNGADGKIPSDMVDGFKAIGNSKCRKLQYFTCDQVIFVLDRYGFDELSQGQRKRLNEHKNGIFEYFKKQTIDGRRLVAEQVQIKKALSRELCGANKLVGPLGAMFKKLMVRDWSEYGDIPGVDSLLECAAMERVNFILNHFEKWTDVAAQNDDEYPVGVGNVFRNLTDYSLRSLQGDVEHILNEHQNKLMELAQSQGCTKKDGCVHLQRDQRSGTAAASADTMESTKWFGANSCSIEDVAATLILDRVHCILRHYSLGKSLLERERTFNKLVTDIATATSPQFAHGVYMKYSELSPKHKNLVTELCQNEMYPLNKEDVDTFIEKARKIMENNAVVRAWKATKSSLRDGVHIGDPIYLEFILCLVLYCSHTKFCTAFRSSFRRLKYEDNEDTIRRRHVDNFYWFGRYLECALIYFGKQSTRKQRFYHGLSAPFVFDSFSAVFEIPVSTTNSSNSAESFTKAHQGVVLHLEPKFTGSNINSRYIAVSKAGLSPFKNEREFLVCDLDSIYLLS